MDAYVPTVRFDELELRASFVRGRPVQARLEGRDWIELEERSANRELSFYRERLCDLDPATRYRVEVSSGNATRCVETATLPRPTSALRCRFAVIPDLHLQPGAHRRSVPDCARGLYPLAEPLARSHLAAIDARSGDDSVDFVVFLGDTLDPASDESIAGLRDLTESISTPSYIVIGNHELYGDYSESDFYRALDLPPEVYRTVVHEDCAFVLLSTSSQRCLAPGSEQFRWLARQLEEHAHERDTFLFAHFSAVLHPLCVTSCRTSNERQIAATRRDTRYPATPPRNP